MHNFISAQTRSGFVKPLIDTRRGAFNTKRLGAVRSNSVVYMALGG